MPSGLHGPEGVRLYYDALARLGAAVERGLITPADYRQRVESIHQWLDDHGVHVSRARGAPSESGERKVVGLYLRAKGRLDLALHRGAMSEQDYGRRLDLIHEWLRRRGVRVVPRSST